MRVQSLDRRLDRRAFHLALADADARAVTAAEVAEFLAAQHAEARDAAEFRAMERDAAYSARELEES